MTVDPAQDLTTDKRDTDKRAEKHARENAAFAALNAALQAHAPLNGLFIEDCLRVAEDRAVFSARLKDQPVVLKHFHGKQGRGGQGAAQAALVHAELTSRYQIMHSGSLRVCQPVALLDGTGITLRAFQAGTRLDRILQTADGPTRRQKLQQAGAWLGLYTSDRTSIGNFGPWKWIKTLPPAENTPHKPLIASLKANLRQQAPDLVGVPVHKARTHGDFASLNLICDGPDMIGIDIENQHSLALTKDMARFLAQAQSYRQPASGWMPESDLSAFLTGFGPLPQPDQIPLLRFFYGVELGKRLLSNTPPPQETANLAAALHSYVASPIDKPAPTD